MPTDFLAASCTGRPFRTALSPSRTMPPPTQTWWVASEVDVQALGIAVGAERRHEAGIAPPSTGFRAFARGGSISLAHRSWSQSARSEDGRGSHRSWSSLGGRPPDNPTQVGRTCDPHRDADASRLPAVNVSGGRLPRRVVRRGRPSRHREWTVRGARPGRSAEGSGGRSRHLCSWSLDAVGASGMSCECEHCLAGGSVRESSVAGGPAAPSRIAGIASRRSSLPWRGRDRAPVGQLGLWELMMDPPCPPFIECDEDDEDDDW